MFSKNKILNKIIEIYLSVFYLFSLIATTITLDKIFDHFHIYNSITSFISLLITIASYTGLAIFIYKDMSKDDNKE